MPRIKHLLVNKKSISTKKIPNPNKIEIESDEFKAIWEVIKDWDVNIPDYYSGYCGANGSHVKLILDALKPVMRNRKIDDVINS